MAVQEHGPKDLVAATIVGTLGASMALWLLFSLISRRGPPEFIYF